MSSSDNTARPSPLIQMRGYVSLPANTANTNDVIKSPASRDNETLHPFAPLARSTDQRWIAQPLDPSAKHLHQSVLLQGTRSIVPGAQAPGSPTLAAARVRVHTSGHRVSTWPGTDNVITLFARSFCHSDTEGGRVPIKRQPPLTVAFNSLVMRFL